jgi:hypothetical protein
MLLVGLQPVRNKAQKQSIKYLESLKFIQKFEEDVDFLTQQLRKRTFEEFIKDPMGERAQEEIAEREKQKLIDPYLQNIDFVHKYADFNDEVRVLNTEEQESMENTQDKIEAELEEEAQCLGPISTNALKKLQVDLHVEVMEKF